VDSVAPSCAAVKTVTILENVRIARDTYRLRLNDPAMARAIRPGQVLMVRPSLASSDPLLGRPFALYDVVLDGRGDPAAVDVVYLVLGPELLVRQGRSFRSHSCLVGNPVSQRDEKTFHARRRTHYPSSMSATRLRVLSCSLSIYGL